MAVHLRHISSPSFALRVLGKDRSMGVATVGTIDSLKAIRPNAG